MSIRVELRDLPYDVAFTSGDLVAGVNTVEHNLDQTYVSVTVYDNNEKIVLPDNVTAVDSNTVDIDLSSWTITGTWHVVIR